MTMNLGSPELLGVAAILGALRWCVPALGREYRQHIDWRDKRKQKKMKAIGKSAA